MDNNDLQKILNQYIDPEFSQEITYDDYRFWLESTIEINKPDFVALLNLKMTNPVVYSKNYNLSIKGINEVKLINIVKSVDPHQIEKIIKADERCLEFVEQNREAMNNTVLQLRFTSFLDPDKPRSFLRTVTFIPKNRKNHSYTLLLITISDITDFLGIQREPSATVRYIRNQDHELVDKLDNLKQELNFILKPSIKLTNREQQILELIGLGQTSDRIAHDLHISVNTVNTHRQNLIRKFKVRNTAALLNML